MTARKNNYLYNIGDIVRYDDMKCKVIDRWWDEHAYNRYRIKRVVGRHVTNEAWMVKEKTIKPYKTKTNG